MSRLNGSTNGNGKLFGPGGSLSPKKLFGEGGSISHPRQLLDAWGEPIRRDAPDHGFQVGHPITFSSILSSGYKSYWHGQYDQAVKHSRDGAVAMKNDCFLQALLNERKFAVASLNWHIEVDDERDKMEVAVRDTLTRILRQTPYFRRFLVYLLEAIWYGRYGSELVWEWAVDKFPSAKQQRLGNNDEMRYLRIKAHQPINGDKIGHAWDGTPYILVNPAFDHNIPNAEIRPTTAGADGLYLRGHWRKHFCIHTHEAVDMDYFDPMGADAIHGFGIRSTLFWLDWLRKEWLGNVADWCERTGLGIRLWYYQANNPNSENAVKRAARESNDRTNIFIPRYGQGSGQGVEGVEYVDTTGSGAELLLKLQEHVEEHIERFIVGQSMSSGQDNESGLGGTGRSNFARDCVPLDSEILTRDGFKSCHDVKIGEEVLAYDTESDTTKWTPLLNKTFFKDCDVSRLKVGVAEHNWEAICTPDHSWATERADYCSRGIASDDVVVGIRGAKLPANRRRSLKKAFDIGVNDKIVLAAKEVETVESVLTPTEAAVLGWVVTDGTFSKNRNGSISIVLYQSKEEHIEEIRELAGLFNAGEWRGKPTTRTFPNGRTYDCKPQHLWRIPMAISESLLKKCGYVFRKDLLKIVTRLSPDARRAMLDAMLKAEGDMYNRFANSDPYIMEAFEILCVLEGHATGVLRHKEYCDTKSLKKYRYATGQRLRMEDAGCEDVWCPTTKYGTWVMRQRGRVTITGNTKMQITAYDAAGLGETVTHDVVKVAQHSTFINNPAAQRVNARFVLNVDEPEPDKVMGAIRTFVVDLGGSVREDGVRAKLGKGFEKPQDGDEVISMETINQQKQAGMPQQPGMPGAMPGDPAAMGGMPGAEAPPQAQATSEPTDTPGSEDVQEKVNSQLDDIVSKMERMHGDIVRYHKEQQEGWIDLSEIPQPEKSDQPAELSELELMDQYKKFFEEILV